MALSVTHSTAADGTFSTDGATAWDASHTLTGTVATAQIADDAVTYAKIQDVSTTDVMLGRSTAGAGIVEEIPVTAAGRAILDDANAAAQRTTLGLAIGTDVQAYDAQLADIAALAVTDGNIIVGDGLNWVAESGATARTSLGLGTGDSPQFTGIELGHATDTTITRSSAGNIAVEGNVVYRAGGTDVALADGGTGASLADPGADRIMFWDDSAGAVTWLTAGTGLTITDTTIAASGGGATLDAITAAAGDQAGIANADNNIRWNWAKTTNSEVAFEFGESAASTNGTSTSGVPNQILAKFSTVAASTMSPLSVYSRAAHVFSVSPTTAQILVTSGSSSAPVISPTGDTDSGIYFNNNKDFSVSVNGTQRMQVDGFSMYIGAGTAATPGLRDTVSANAGLFWASTVLGVSVSGIENSRFTAGLWQTSKGTADAVAYAINARKSRGTVASPTVITTGDDLLTISGYGYVGATNTYQEAARITFDSTGTISDSATGIGGIIRFSHAIVGAEPAEVGMFRSQHLIHEGTSPTITAGGGTSPTIAGKDEAFDVTIGTGGVATSFEVTFANAFTTNAPIAAAQSDTDIIALKVATTTTTVTVTASTPFTAGSKVHVICRGWE